MTLILHNYREGIKDVAEQMVVLESLYNLLNIPYNPPSDRGLSINADLLCDLMTKCNLHGITIRYDLMDIADKLQYFIDYLFANNRITPMALSSEIQRVFPKYPQSWFCPAVLH